MHSGCQAPGLSHQCARHAQLDAAHAASQLGCPRTSPHNQLLPIGLQLQTSGQGRSARMPLPLQHVSPPAPVLPDMDVCCAAWASLADDDGEDAAADAAPDAAGEAPGAAGEQGDDLFMSFQSLEEAEVKRVSACSISCCHCRCLVLSSVWPQLWASRPTLLVSQRRPQVLR